MPTVDSFVQYSQERKFRSVVVEHILAGRPEDAVKLLSEHYGVKPPEIRVGTVKGHRHVLACYVGRERRIYFSRSEYLSAPFIVLHEFYHHLRASQVKGKNQVEKRADLFASNFILDYRGHRIVDSLNRRD